MGGHTTGWRWYNLWATWCKPCVEEIPILQRWRERFGREGKPVELVFLSVDTSGEAIDAFRKRYPNTPRTLRVEDADSIPSWLGTLGLEENAAIPIHVFVSNGRLRCVRSGALASNHYETVAALLSGSLSSGVEQNATEF
ncbi:MAG: TlpA disulfide reductase family protein [Polyangiales bacterium]